MIWYFSGRSLSIRFLTLITPIRPFSGTCPRG
jgi:hypothetical protein